MHHTRLSAAAGIIALVLLVGFVLSVPHTRDLMRPAPAPAPEVATPVVTLSTHYAKGTYTLSGTVTAPDACTIVSAAAALQGADASTSTTTTGQSIALALTWSPDVGTCLMLPTPMSFSTTLVAPRDLPVSVTVNGAMASTTGS
jgi:hypothetical protein